jgi:hypothetical protein
MLECTRSVSSTDHGPPVVWVVLAAVEVEAGLALVVLQHLGQGHKSRG